MIKAGPTSIDPVRIGEFSRIGIQAKTAKGTLEIIKDFELCKKGDIVTATVSTITKLLNIIPFHYALSLK